MQPKTDGQKDPGAVQALGTGVNPRSQLGSSCTVILLLFMNILILKQQIPESADLQLFLVGTFRAVPRARLVAA